MRSIHESQPYVQHLLAEHRRLRSKLQSVRNALAQRDTMQAANWADLLPALHLVREELAHHFREEEQGGCLEEAASYCPNLSPQVRRIEGEHPLLLATLDRIIAQVADARTTVEERPAIRARFLGLCRDLHIHEAAENDLLRRGFGTNVNGEGHSWALEPVEV